MVVYEYVVYRVMRKGIESTHATPSNETIMRLVCETKYDLQD
jgi:hypothetical protein